MVFLTGCGLKGEENAVKETAQESSTQNPAQSSAGEGAESDSGEEGAEPSPTQEKPEAVPNISVNRLGYITKGDKAAIFMEKSCLRSFMWSEQRAERWYLQAISEIMDIMRRGRNIMVMGIFRRSRKAEPII